MTKNTKPPSRPPSGGEIAAALASAWIGMAALVAAHLWSVARPAEANGALLKLGSWMPGWWGIGPYAGKETVALAAWLISWLALSVGLRRLDVSVKRCAFAFAVGFVLLLMAAWPPLYHALFGWGPAGG